MADCCDPRGYRGMFSEREAKRAAWWFEKRGLDSTAGPMVKALAEQGLEGATVLEVGAGSATAVVSLLEAGADRAIAYDISPEYEPVATTLLERHGVEDRAELRYADFVAERDRVGRADVVFLNRVVCCYPDMPGMVDAAADNAGARLAMSYPRDRWLTRVGFRLINAFLRLRRSTFRVFVHDPDDISHRVAAEGLAETDSGKTLLWEWHVWERPRG